MKTILIQCVNYDQGFIQQILIDFEWFHKLLINPNISVFIWQA